MDTNVKVKTVDNYSDSLGKYIGCKGTLLLIDEQRDTCVGLIRCIKDWESLIDPEDDYARVGDISFGKNISKGVFEFWQPIQVVIISETEEICAGDKILHKGEILTVSNNKGNYLSVYEHVNIDIRADICKKILAMPKEINSTIIGMIVAGTIRNNEQVFLECYGALDQYFIDKTYGCAKVMPAKGKTTWNDISNEVKKFCDENNYTSKPLGTVMPFIIEHLSGKYESPKIIA